MAKQKYLLPVLALVLAEVLWGINTPVIKLGLQTVPLPVYHSITILGAALLIAPFARRDWKRLRRKDYALLILGSIIAISLGNVALLLGLQWVPSINAPLIGLFSPVLLFILSAQFLKERLSLKTFVGILISFAGAAVIIGKPWEAAVVGQSVVIGNLLLVLSMLCGVIGTLICKTALKRGGSYQVTFIHLFVGILPVALFALPYIPTLSVASIGRTGFIAMTYNILAVAIANAFYMYGLKLKKAQVVGVFSYIHPVVTAVAAWIILAEVPDKKIVWGALLIFAGIYLAEVKRKHHRSY